MKYLLIDSLTHRIMSIEQTEFDVVPSLYFVEVLADTDVQVGDLYLDNKVVLFRKCITYLKTNCTVTKEFDDISLVTSEYTIKKPTSIFDEFVDSTWVTNIKKKHIFEYNKVDDRRRALYSQVVDPLLAEAKIKRLMKKDAEAADYETQAVAARKKIQVENPFPVGE